MNAVEAQALKRAREDNRRNSNITPLPKQGDILDVGVRRGLSVYKVLYSKPALYNNLLSPKGYVEVYLIPNQHFTSHV